MAPRRRAGLSRSALLLTVALLGCNDRTPAPTAVAAPPRPPRPSGSALTRPDTAKLLLERGEQSENGTAPALGARNAPLSLVVFEDYSSPDCGRLAPLPEVAENLHAGRIRLVFRQYPASSRPESTLAAQAALAAHAQGKFWPYRAILFANPHDHSRPALVRYAREVGLDVPAFERALERGEYRADVLADRDLGERLLIRNVPAVFANGRPVSAPYGVTELAKLVSAVGSER